MKTMLIVLSYVVVLVLGGWLGVMFARRNPEKAKIIDASGTSLTDSAKELAKTTADKAIETIKDKIS